MSSRQQPFAAGSRPRQPNPQSSASQHGRASPQETHEEYGAGDDQDMQEQYQEQGGESENGEYGEDQGHEDWQEEEHEDPQDEKKDENKDEGEKGGASAASDVGKLKHSKFPQDPHHSSTMSLFHQIAAQGYTEDHVHSFIHVLVLIVAMLAFHSGMTAGHHETHEAAAAAHQGGKPEEGDAE